MDAGSKKPEKVNITLTSDNIYARSEIKDGADYITEACLSPDGERLVVTARGEVFNLPVEKGVTKNITRNGRPTANSSSIFRMRPERQNSICRMPLEANTSS